MTATSRRDFLTLCAAAAPALATTPALLLARAAQASAGYRTPAALERYLDPLPIPAQLQAQGGPARDGVDYRMRMLACTHQLHSQLPPTRLWGYEGLYPGPTIEATRNQRMRIRWENHLPTEHLFAIDPHIMKSMHAMGPAPAVRTVPHLHGAFTSSESDGLPERWFVPGASALYTYPNRQAAATLWYHDHPMGSTRLNVYAGLAGFCLLRDEEEGSMGLPRGAYEVPLMLQDRTLDDAGQLVYNPTHEDGFALPAGVWGPEFFGRLPVVNGAIYPYLEVEPCRYRLRVVNAANSRFFRLFFNLARHTTDVPSLLPFHQIGSDGGLLGSPVKLEKLLLGPAERADLIVDFSALAGKTITLANDAEAPYPGWAMMGAHHEHLYELMQIRVSRPLSARAADFSMPPVRPMPPPDPTTATVTRQFMLVEQLDGQSKSLGVRIDGKGYGDPVSEFIKLGAVELWRFVNTTDDAHPMHLHLVQFRIVERQGYDPAAIVSGRVQFVGAPRPPAPNEAGWKDTALVYPRETLTILARFDGYTGRFGFHCHMLEHEDNDMMRPFEIIQS